MKTPMKIRISCNRCNKLVAQLANGSQVASGTVFLCHGCATGSADEKKVRKQTRTSRKRTDK